MTSNTLKGTSHNAPRIPIRNKIHIQPCISFPSRVPQVVIQFQERYNRISQLLDENLAVLEAVHADLSMPCSAAGRQSTFSSKQFLHMIIVKIIQELSLRDVIIRVSDSDFFRNFTKIFSGDVMGFTELDNFRDSEDMYSSKCVFEKVSFQSQVPPLKTVACLMRLEAAENKKARNEGKINTR